MRRAEPVAARPGLRPGSLPVLRPRPRRRAAVPLGGLRLSLRRRLRRGQRAAARPPLRPRAAAPTCKPARPAHLRDFYALDDLSMLDREPPAHTRLRGLVLRAFTSRRIAALAPEIAALAHAADRPPRRPPSFDLLPAFAERLPVIVIARLLGVPEDMADRAARLVARHGGDVPGPPRPRGRGRAPTPPPATSPPSCADMSRPAAPRPADDLLTAADRRRSRTATG